MRGGLDFANPLMLYERNIIPKPVKHPDVKDMHALPRLNQQSLSI
jgi:hypothetical protein